MSRSWYSASVPDFLSAEADTILGALTRASTFPVEATQRDAWLEQIALLQPLLTGPAFATGSIHFEYAIPRMGRRIDVVLVLDRVVFVLEFKVGEREFARHAADQAVDYALDLKNFHETSRDVWIAPVLIATRAPDRLVYVTGTPQDDRLLAPLFANPATLPEVLQAVRAFCTEGGTAPAVSKDWAAGGYHPTPSIVEAAMALYRGHAVEEISRSDAGAKNLSETSTAVSAIIAEAKARSRKALVFVTGVPGAGKTLVGLNIATQHSDTTDGLYSVFLSGNGPLVAVLREALARDKVRAEKEQGKKLSKKQARSAVETFIQNVHHFRDDCLVDARPPREHVALFDEAQRAWDLPMTADFMKRKKGKPDFAQSEPEFLISCLDRHPDWAVVVCLVGGGQEINRGEAGIGEWAASIQRSFPSWDVVMSSRLTDSEYAAGPALKALEAGSRVTWNDQLHLSVSMRSFRAENVSLFVKKLLDCDVEGARAALASLQGKFPIVLARSVPEAREWLRRQARGSERYGILVSSQAYRLKPHAIDVRAPVDPVHWFLDDKEDVRSSYYLEDAATEFQVQGLELDWACVTWDADFRFVPDSPATPTQGHWEHWSFVGSAWQRINKPERQMYLKNAYRVLLTRARQGMVIGVPEGDFRGWPSRTAVPRWDAILKFSSKTRDF